MITAHERRIARELSIVYVVFGGIVTSVQMATAWGSVPQWITAMVAAFALLVAAIGIFVQWKIARRRAAIDFFIKTEMDKHLLDSYDQFWLGIDRMKEMNVADFYSSKETEVRTHYFSVRKYLNVHELIAVGIKNEMLDDKICFDFWCDVLLRGVDAARPLVDFVRQQRGHQSTYDELITLYNRWKAKAERLAKGAARPAWQQPEPMQ